jgi:hypothetical protein
VPTARSRTSLPTTATTSTIPTNALAVLSMGTAADTGKAAAYIELKKLVHAQTLDCPH